MAKYTENFNLIKPEDDEYYDVADFNENMDIIDEALSENSGASEQLQGIISPDGKGVRIIKSIQRITTSSSKAFPITPVDPGRCIVLFERLYDHGSYHISCSYTLTASTLHVSISNISDGLFGFWIVEFY